MPSSRRDFLSKAAAAGLACGMRRAGGQSMPGMAMPKTGRVAAAPVRMLHTLQLPPFVDPMPLPLVVRPTSHGNYDALSVTMHEVHAKVHRDVPPTRMWSYGPGALAPVIEARSHRELRVTWNNQLPRKHFLPIDYSLHGSGRDVPEVRTVAHLHGASVPSKYDGYPEDWFPVGGSRTCIYPMRQDAATLWYHDHAMGLNRLNTYAGLFGMLWLRDSVEDALQLPMGPYEVPLILYDRDFTADGQLFYDVSEREESPWIPEFSADGLMVNGKIRPYFEVEPRLYRFRALNTANSRFYVLSLSDGSSFYQIGSDQGLLAAPVEMKRLVLGCAERADLLVDFSRHAGGTLQLRAGATDMLQFRVAKSASSQERNRVPSTLRAVERIPQNEAVKTRTITLHEYDNSRKQPMVMLLNRRHWHEPTTEFVKLNSTEIWEFVNLTEDTHPMHIHLVRFQVLDRRQFEVSEYLLNRRLNYLAAAEPPPAHEAGWKDVVQCPPGTITRIIARFTGYPGKYLYHCHILEHEANDMMRPFEVVA